MSKDPAFLFYYQDFAYGTRKMSFTEKGAYIELLCEQADSGHLSIDDIKRALGDQAFLWETIKHKFDQENGLFYNRVLTNHMNKRKNYVESRISNLQGKKELITEKQIVKNPKKKDIKKFDFEPIWKMYPKKLGKKEAFGYFQMTVKMDEDYENIKKALANYVGYIKTNCVEAKYIKAGCNWFNDWESWVDYEEAQKITNTRNIPDASETLDKMKQWELEQKTEQERKK